MSYNSQTPYAYQNIFNHSQRSTQVTPFNQQSYPYAHSQNTQSQTFLQSGTSQPIQTGINPEAPEFIPQLNNQQQYGMNHQMQQGMSYQQMQQDQQEVEQYLQPFLDEEEQETEDPGSFQGVSYQEPINQYQYQRPPQYQQYNQMQQPYLPFNPPYLQQYQSQMIQLPSHYYKMQPSLFVPNFSQSQPYGKSQKQQQASSQQRKYQNNINKFDTEIKPQRKDLEPRTVKKEKQEGFL